MKKNVMIRIVHLKTDRIYLLVADGDDGLHCICIGTRHFILVTSKELGQIKP